MIGPETMGAPYPIDALGPVLEAAARGIMEKIQVPAAIAAHSVLGVASLAAQALADVFLPYGHACPLSLFFLSIAISGDRKTNADREAMVPVKDYERALDEAFRPARRKYEIDVELWERKFQEDGRAGLSDDKLREARERLGDKPEPPLTAVLTLDETTTEGLAKHMPTMPGALGIFSSEGGQFLGGHGFTADFKLRTVAALGALWDGAGLRRLRAGDGLVNLKGRRLASHLLIQSDVAAGVLQDPVLRDQGFLARLLISAPTSITGTRFWKPPTNNVAADLRAYADRMLEILQTPPCTLNPAGNQLNPRALVLSPDALEVWIEFYNRVEAAEAKGGRFEELRDVASKAAEQAARIAGVMTIVCDIDAASVSADAMRRGVVLMDYYLDEAVRLAGAAMIPAAIRDGQTLLDWLHARALRLVSAAEIQKHGPNKLRKKASLDPAILSLVSHGWLSPTDSFGRAWTVHPPIAASSEFSPIAAESVTAFEHRDAPGPQQPREPQAIAEAPTSVPDEPQQPQEPQLAVETPTSAQGGPQQPQEPQAVVEAPAQMQNDPQEPTE